MQAMNDWIHFERVDVKTKGKIKLTQEVLETYGPIARIVSIGDGVSMDMKIEIGDYIVLNSHLGTMCMVNGTECLFVKADGIIAKLTKKEAETPLDISKIKKRPAGNIVIPDIEKQIIT